MLLNSRRLLMTLWMLMLLLQGIIVLSQGVKILPERQCGIAWPVELAYVTGSGFGIQTGKRTLFLFCDSQREAGGWLDILVGLTSFGILPAALPPGSGSMSSVDSSISSIRGASLGSSGSAQRASSNLPPCGPLPELPESPHSSEDEVRANNGHLIKPIQKEGGGVGGREREEMGICTRLAWMVVTFVLSCCHLQTWPLLAASLVCA